MGRVWKLVNINNLSSTSLSKAQHYFSSTTWSWTSEKEGSHVMRGSRHKKWFTEVHAIFWLRVIPPEHFRVQGDDVQRQAALWDNSRCSISAVFPTGSLLSPSPVPQMLHLIPSNFPNLPEDKGSLEVLVKYRPLHALPAQSPLAPRPGSVFFLKPQGGLGVYSLPQVILFKKHIL